MYSTAVEPDPDAPTKKDAPISELYIYYGSLHESCVHERLKAYVCVLYDSLCAPLLLPWLGEVEGTSLAMYQAKASPVPAHVPMFRVPTVLRRVPSAVPPTVADHRERLHHLKSGPWGHSRL